MPIAPPDVAAVRRFNRFYTRQLGLLQKGVHHSPFTLTEGRVLYEVATRPGVLASELVRDLQVDAGYLSRILKRFEGDGLVARRRSAEDARQASLSVTAKGRRTFASLDRNSSAEAGAMLDRLPETRRGELLRSLRSVESLLAPESPAPVTLRDLHVGDLGWITHRHGVLYHREYGWDARFEAMVAEILVDFVRDFDRENERAWVAEAGGQVVGSVFLARKSARVAKLRLLYVEPSFRGHGLGRRLVDECIAFARGRGYRKLILWTMNVLVSAARIYEAAGFKLVAEEPNRWFGKDLVGRTWELDLTSRPSRPSATSASSAPSRKPARSAS
jgi:DNA-binding MarR family transcriptional regulator/GNAT superfamily N-acetyltransferase